MAKTCSVCSHPSCALEESVRQPKMDSFSRRGDQPRGIHQRVACARHFFRHSTVQNINWFAEEAEGVEEGRRRRMVVVVVVVVTAAGNLGDLVRVQLKPRPTWMVPPIRSSTSHSSSPYLEKKNLLFFF